jgi:hypothetical protein
LVNEKYMLMKLTEGFFAHSEVHSLNH